MPVEGVLEANGQVRGTEVTASAKIPGIADIVATELPGVRAETRIRYNPQLEFRHFMAISMIVVAGLMVGVITTAARKWSNCPSGEHGGDLGWLSSTDCAPEFARELFGRIEVGVLPRLVHSRFGLHAVEVLERAPGDEPPFEQVRGAVALSLRQRAWVTTLRQYLQVLAGKAAVEGVVLDSADTPLVQ